MSPSPKWVCIDLFLESYIPPVGDGFNLLNEGIVSSSRAKVSFQSLHFWLALSFLYLPNLQFSFLYQSWSCLFLHVYMLFFWFIIIRQFPLHLVRVQCIKNHVIAWILCHCSRLLPRGLLFTFLPGTTPVS